MKRNNRKPNNSNKKIKKVDGITVVSPLYGPRKIVDRMIFSVLHQFVSKDNPYKINLVLVNDYIENIHEYDYYISDEFKDFYDDKFIEITLINNEEHKYQGESREIYQRPYRLSRDLQKVGPVRLPSLAALG